MRARRFSTGLMGLLTVLATGPALAADGDAAGQAQNTAGRPSPPSTSNPGVGQGPGATAGSDGALSNPAVGRTEPMPGSAPGGQPTRDPGQVTEMGSPGTETNPGTSGPSTGTGRP